MIEEHDDKDDPELDDDDLDDDDLDAPGWQAIDLAVSARFPGQTPHQFTSKHPFELDKPNPLPAITVWEGEDPLRWHFVTYGLTELFEKVAPDPEISGFGFELTLQVPRDGTNRPPAWGLRVLQALGHAVLTSREGFDSGHIIHTGPGMVPGKESGLEGFVLVPDPDLGKINTPFGSLLFLRLIGVNDEEIEILKELDLPELVGALTELTPSGLTEPDRKSWLDDPEKSKILRRYKLGLEL